MMEFLDKIYGYEHFGIILFSVIAILIVLFMIILFFGKKDEKKKEIERTQKLAAEELQNNLATDTFKEEVVEPQAIDVTKSIIPPIENALAFPISSEPVVESKESKLEETPIVNPLDIKPNIPVFEPVIPSTPELPEIESVPVTPVVNEPVVAPVLEPATEPKLMTQQVEEVVIPKVESVIPKEVVVAPVEMPILQSAAEAPVNELPEIEIPEFNFDELAVSIANELKDLEKNKSIETVTPVEATVTPMENIVKPSPAPGPQVFSSVYINKPVAPVEEAKVVDPVIPSAPVAPVSTTNSEPVVNPVIDLPKPAEMPALKETPQNKVNEMSTTIPDFSQFEGESYDIK